LDKIGAFSGDSFLGDILCFFDLFIPLKLPRPIAVNQTSIFAKQREVKAGSTITSEPLHE
jgi:hypothetical protein